MFNGSSVLIVDDDAFVAMELSETIRDLGGAVIGPLSTVTAALAILETTRIDAAILDLHLVDREVSPVALTLIDRGVPVVIYSGFELPPQLLPVREVLPLVPKHLPPKAAVTQLLARMAPRASTDPASSARTAVSEYTSLTRRQIECLRLVLQSKSSREIGSALGFPPAVADDVLRSACTRLGVGTRLEAAMVAVHLGLIDV